MSQMGSQRVKFQLRWAKAMLHFQLHPPGTALLLSFSTGSLFILGKWVPGSCHLGGVGPRNLRAIYCFRRLLSLEKPLTESRLCCTGLSWEGLDTSSFGREG